MTSWLRKLGPSAVALTFALAITGCDDGGGRRLFTLFFGINGFDDCTRVVVEIDLDAAGAVIAEDGNGDLMCFLNALLDASGCLVDFDLVNGTFTATIDECTIPAVSALFSCRFRTGVLSSIRAVTTATCVCNEPLCDEDPDVCVGDASMGSDPTACEDCTDGIDNDNDGKTDCEDPGCQSDPACGTTLPTTSTSTTTTSSSTTTTTQSSTTTTSSTVTTTSTTTSTTVPWQVRCRLVFHVPEDVDLGSLQWDTDYNAAPGVFVGAGGQVECAGLVDGGIAQFNDKEDELIMTAGIIHQTGFSAPLDVAECTLVATIDPVPEDFTLTTTDAADPDINPMIPLPEVILRSIECVSIVTTTSTIPNIETTSTSSTTAPIETTTTTTTTAGGGGDTYTITFSIDATIESVGAVQFDVDYSGAPGGFVDNAGEPVCAALPVVAGFGAFNDDTGSSVLTGGVISFSGFNTPAAIAECEFASTGAAPVPGDFSVTTTDASFSTTLPIDPFPDVSVGVAVSAP